MPDCIIEDNTIMNFKVKDAQGSRGTKGKLVSEHLISLVPLEVRRRKYVPHV
jgi:hypothetical protein